MVIKDKVILICGAGGIFGKSITKYLVSQDAIVIAMDLFNIAINKDFSNLIKKKNFFYFKCDSTDEKKLTSIKKLINKKFKKIDVLINLSSITDPVEGKKQLIKFEDFKKKDFSEIVSKNLLATFIPCKVFGSEMSRIKKGSIINFSSTYGLVGPDQKIYENRKKKFFIKNPAYPTSKGGIIAFTKYLASYWGNKNIRVNCIVPGGVENKQNKIFIKNYSSKTALGRMATSEDLNGIIHLLCSKNSSYITGSTIVVDGGWTAI